MKKLLTNLTGTFMMGLGISLLISVDMGVDAISLIYLGILEHVSIELWILSLLINLLFVLLVLLLDRRLIGVGTILNFIGISWCLKVLPPLLNPSLLNNNAFFLILAVVILACGSGLYARAEMGSAALEALAQAVSQILHFDFAKVRMSLDGITILIGLALGAPLGIGTPLCILFIGPISKYVMTWNR